VRVLVLLLALAISPLTLTVCEWACLLPAAAADRAAMPSCHDDMDALAGPAMKASTPCEHDRALARLQLAARSVPFALIVALIPQPVRVAAAPMLEHAAPPVGAASWSPPPRSFSLRI